jgi:hypothetical protein
MVTICSRHRVIRRFILSLILTAIGSWLNTQLVHDLYLKSMEVHLPMIDLRNSLVKSLCNIFLCINKLLQVVALAGAVDVSP